MKLDTALDFFQAVWVVGEPLIEFGRASRLLPTKLERGQTMRVWTAASGLQESLASTTRKDSITAEAELVKACLTEPGLIVMADGVKFGGHIVHALLKAIVDDRRIVFICSDNPPDSFLSDYLAVVDETEDWSEAEAKAMLDENEHYGHKFSKEMMPPLQGLRAYRASSLLLTTLAETEPAQDIVAALYSNRGRYIAEESQGVVTMIEPTQTYADLIGLSRAKRILMALANTDKDRRGVLLVGHPGGGKTSIVKATANESGLPLYAFDVGSAYAGIVGETQRKMRKAISLLKRTPAGIVLVDEIEKALAGVQASTSGVTSSGVTAQAGMYLLQYLDAPLAANGGMHLILATSNDVTSLPAEYTRAGRWDAILRTSMPTPERALSILALYRAKYKLPAKFGLKASLDKMTPAEIESTCRIAAVMGETEWDAAVAYVPTLFRVRPEGLEAFDKWSKGQAIDADDPDDSGLVASQAMKRKGRK